MEKCNLRVTIENKDSKQVYEVVGNYNELEDDLKYIEQDELNTICKYNFKSNRLVRRNNNLIMEYNFDINKNTLGVIKLKELDREVNINIKTTKLERDNLNLYVEFLVEDDKMIYKIEVI